MHTICDRTRGHGLSALCLVAALVLTTGGCYSTIAAWNESKHIRENISALTVGLLSDVDAVKKLKGVYQAAQDRFASLTAKIKSGEITENITQLIAEGMTAINEARAIWDEGQRRFSERKAQLAKAQADLKLFQKEHEVPWWQIGIGVAGTIITTLTGAGYIKRGSKLGEAVAFGARALNGVQTLYGANSTTLNPDDKDSPERAKIKAELFAVIKKEVDDAKCPVIQGHHDEVKAIKARTTAA